MEDNSRQRGAGCLGAPTRTFEGEQRRGAALTGGHGGCFGGGAGGGAACLQRRRHRLCGSGRSQAEGGPQALQGRGNGCSQG